MSGAGGEGQRLLPRPDHKAGAVLLIFLFPALGGFLYGYDIGCTSLVVSQLGDPDHSGVSWSDVASGKIIKGLITSASIAGAFVGSCIVFPLADRLGRRRELLVGAVLYAAGAVISALTTLYGSSAGVGLTHMVAGRFVYGIGIGISMHGAPSYISEMSPASLRGTLISAKEGLIVLGVLVGNSIGYALKSTPSGWVYVFLFEVFFAWIMFGGNFWLPPSARWLAIARPHDRDAITRSVAFVFDDAAAEQVTREIVEQALDMEAAAADEGEGEGEGEAGKGEGFLGALKRLLTSTKYRGQLVAGIGVVALQQVTGQPSVLYYTDTIFRDAGVGSWANLATGGFKLVATLFSVFVVDRLGRKQLLYAGNAVMAVSLLAVSVAFYGYESDDAGSGGGLATISLQGAIILSCLLLFIGGYQVGFGPIAWTLIAEIFPLEVRGQAVALAVQTNFFLNLVVSFFFLLELDLVGASATFGVFAGVLFFSLYFVHRFVPETKGMTLEQIERFFEVRDAGEAAARAF